MANTIIPIEKFRTLLEGRKKIYIYVETTGQSVLPSSLTGWIAIDKKHYLSRFHDFHAYSGIEVDDETYSIYIERFILKAPNDIVQAG